MSADLTEAEKKKVQIEVAALRAGHRGMSDVFSVIEGIVADRLFAVEADRDQWKDVAHVGAFWQSRAEAAERKVAAMEAERDALAAAVDRVRRRHPRGGEEPGLLAPGKWCPTCGRERSDNGYGACPDRAALTEPDLQETP